MGDSRSSSSAQALGVIQIPVMDFCARRDRGLCVGVGAGEGEDVGVVREELLHEHRADAARFSRDESAD